MVRFAGSFELFLADFGALTPIAFVMVAGCSTAVAARTDPAPSTAIRQRGACADIGGNRLELRNWLG